MKRQFLAVSLLCQAIFCGEISLTISAGKSDRLNTPVFFDVPENAGQPPYFLQSDSKTVLSVQTSGKRACVIVPQMKAGSQQRFVWHSGGDSPKSSLATESKDGRLRISLAGKDVLTYQFEKGKLPDGYETVFHRGGYIHPVLTPSGKLITDDYPPDHKHHHGIWFPWTKTEFEGRHPDFWNMGGKTGSVEFVSMDEPQTGMVFSRFTTRHRFIDLSATPPKVALNESWTVTLFAVQGAARPYFLFDLESTQECASDSPLKLPKYHYGGLGVRGHAQWNKAPNAFFLTSEGKTRADGNETRGRWCHLGGKVDGDLCGIAILGHPQNFRAPQPMRLNPTEPFFCFAPSQLGDWEIKPGEKYASRYRFVVADGPPDAEELNRLWNDYAEPPEVK